LAHEAIINECLLHKDTNKIVNHVFLGHDYGKIACSHRQAGNCDLRFIYCFHWHDIRSWDTDVCAISFVSWFTSLDEPMGYLLTAHCALYLFVRSFFLFGPNSHSRPAANRIPTRTNWR